MLYNVAYYTLSTGTIVLSAYGLLYLIDPATARDLSIHISWESLNMYHRIKNKINKLFVEKEKTDKPYNELKEPVKDIFLGYNTNDDTTYKSEDMNAEYLKNNNFDIMIIIQKDEEEDTEYYKRITDKNQLTSYNFDKGNKVFLQVEIEQNGERISIHDNLDQFYLNNNKILDKNFLKWYLNYFYSMELSSDYKLHIIDSDINIFVLKHDDEVLLTKNNNKMSYKIQKNK